MGTTQESNAATELLILIILNREIKNVHSHGQMSPTGYTQRRGPGELNRRWSQVGKSRVKNLASPGRTKLDQENWF